MKSWWLVAFGVICGLLAAGGILLASSPPRGHAIQLHPPPTAVPIQVHITGAVVAPGVYPLPRASRVGDAIAAAGGFSDEAAQDQINLAAPLEDGTQLWVPAQIQNTTAPQNDVSSQENTPSIGVPTHSTSIKININTASQAELETLSGIGPVTAQKIIEFRQINGDFVGIEDIQKVSGIGPATFEKIRDYITTGKSP